jgi:Asp-tRNA(Asn)/Glu-tRNA(Gln) amidotransferase A subunit family amidase
MTFLSIAAAVEARLEQIAKRSSLNAFITVDKAGAMRSARRLDVERADLPLRGIMLAVKDNIHVAGLPNSAGTPALKNFIAPDSSPAVARLQKAGCIVLGKAGLHELAMGITSKNEAFGAIRNPLNEKLIPGGSSGGTAVAVAAELADAGLGTDTGGSMRIPAALTGIVGFRPTSGLYSQAGLTMISPTRDTIGVMAKTADKAARLHEVITGRTVGSLPSRIRLGIPESHFCDGLDPDVSAAFRRYLDTLDHAGFELVYVDMTNVPELNAALSAPIVMHEIALTVPAYLASYRTGVTADALLADVAGADVRALLNLAFSGHIIKSAYEKALLIDRPRLRRAFADYFLSNRLDAVTFPTVPITARPIEGIEVGVRVNGALQDTFATHIRNTDPASNAGVPALSLPGGKDRSGLPIGMEIQGPEGSDVRLLAIGKAIEEALHGTF